MSAASPEAQSVFKSAKTITDLPSFDPQLALSIINQLKNPENKLIEIKPFLFQRAICLEGLVFYLNQLNQYYELELPVPTIKSLAQPTTLTAWETALSQFTAPKPETEFQAIVPTQDRLKEWQQELKAWEEKYDQTQTTAPQETLPLGLQGLEAEIKRLQQHQALLEQVVASNLEKQLSFLEVDEREQIAKTLGQHLSREVLTTIETVTQDHMQQVKQGQLEPQKAPSAIQQVIKANLDHQFFTNALEDLCQQDPAISALIPSSNIVKLAQQTQKSNQQFFKPPPRQPAYNFQAATQAHQAIRTLKRITAPKRSELIKLFQQELNIPFKQAEDLVCRLETKLHPNPTPTEVRNIVKKSILQTPATAPFIQKQRLSPEAIAELYVDQVSSYYVAQAHTLVQPEKGWFFSPTQLDVAWAQKLQKKGFDVSPSVVSNLLRGVTVEKLEAEIARLKQAGFDTAQLLTLKEKIGYLEENYSQLPFLFRRRVRLSRLKANFLQLAEKINPLSLKFYGHHFPKIYNRLDPRFKLLNKQWNYLTKESSLGIIFHPFTKIRQLNYRFYNWRWQKWTGLINRLPISHRSKKFWSTFPYKIQPRYWLRPTFWTRRLAARTAFKTGVFFSRRLGNKILGRKIRDVGRLLYNNSFKEIIKLGATRLLGALGLSATGIGTVFAVTGAIKTGIQILTDPRKRKAALDLVNKGLQAAGGALLGFLKIIATFPATFALSGVGFAVFGPWGAGAGFLAGLGIDKFAKAFSKAGSALSGLLSKAGPAVSEFVAGTTTAQTFSTIAAGATVTAVGATALSTYAVIYSNSSAFVAPPEGIPIGPEAQLISVSKMADPSTVKTGDTVTYTITITSSANKLIVKSVIDKVPTAFLENIEISPSEPEASFNPGTGEISWPEFDLSGMGATKIFTYQALVKAGVNENTKITNTVTVEAEVTLEDDTIETIIRRAWFTLNSDGAEIAQRALEIIAGLKKGFWNYYNQSTDYPELFDKDEYNCCNDQLCCGGCCPDGPGYLPSHNHCYLSHNNPACCCGDPAAITSANSMFWCTWLVIKSYQETGHSVPYQLGVYSMQQQWPAGKFKPPNTDISELGLGDVIFFKKEDPENPGNLRWAHVGIICKLDDLPDSITVCESNNYATLIPYTVENSQVLGTQTLIVAGFGKP